MEGLRVKRREYQRKYVSNRLEKQKSKYLRHEVLYKIISSSPV